MPSKLKENKATVAAFILDWISSIIPTFVGIFVAFITALLFWRCFCRDDKKNRVHSSEDLTTRDICKIAFNKPVHCFISLDCNYPCYIARPKPRFQDVDSDGIHMAKLCGLSFIALFLTFLIDFYRYWVWRHYHPSTDEYCHCTLSKKHQRYIPYHLMGMHHTMLFGDEPCADGYVCTNRNLEHIMIFHLDEHKPQQRYSAIRKSEKLEDTIYIGFHQTSPANSSSIAHSDFRPSSEGKLAPGIYFARSKAGTEYKANQHGAYIAAEVHMGRVKEVTDENLNDFKNPNSSPSDAVYLNHENEDKDEFCVKDASQIKKWVIVVDQQYDTRPKKLGLINEFDDTRMGCDYIYC
ncbi:unnamed protein product [Rotaria sp. Silwood2]|nr:unnamed protein product [Rotaria sp. Silwood2]CAF2938163.1 unnamed protein product [Rotaria sp. Silwood2]CAF3314854.1 unnamed protein product [Rotaria sp. Silwood2]CAF4453912.1 unnamed protein product [Rotaria sp. Silwood2]CAF4498888.1 unnamed protein product [Rotaria sp. Silwood2]